MKTSSTNPSNVSDPTTTPNSKSEVIFKTDNKDINNKHLQTSHCDITHIYEFLGVRTSQSWLQVAIENIPTILQDHANCEKKAAGTAMNLIFRYEFNQELQVKLAQLIREEVLHYEQVLGLMADRNQQWQHLPASRYAKGMLKHKRTYEPAAIIDVLIIGAFIEARSCERFAALSEFIPDEKLAKYYRYLLKSESRHYEDYLYLAKTLTSNKTLYTNSQKNTDSLDSDIENIEDRIAFFKNVENELISSPDEELRFHSGVPVATMS